MRKVIMLICVGGDERSGHLKGRSAGELAAKRGAQRIS